MAYEQKPLRRHRAQYNSANSTNKLTYQLVIDGAKVTPTSATITIYRSGSTTALVSAAAMTVSGTLLTYAISTTTTASWPIENGYRAELTITYSAATYVRAVMVDVVRFVMDVQLGYDQLVSVDDGIRGMDVNGDADFSPLIESCRDDLQLILEAKLLDDGRFLENMALDHSKIGACFKYYVLSQFWFMKDNTERSAAYKAKFDKMLTATLATMSFDKSQDGSEDGKQGGLEQVRFAT